MASPVVTITMDSGDVMRAELYPQTAPNTINNFIDLVNKDFYDGRIFYRVIGRLMIQGGYPDENGMGDSSYPIREGSSQNGFKNDLKHMAGVLSMTRFMMPGSAGPQFSITHTTSSHLDGAYTRFRKVTEGTDVANKVADMQTDYNDRPTKKQKIKSMTAETFEETYPEPETV